MIKSDRQKIARKVVKFTTIIVVLSITSLIFTSIFPWISISENDYVKKDLHFFFEMIQKSNNDQIYDLAGDLNFINLSFWALIILGLLSFLGATIHISKKISKLGYILLSLGCTTLLFSIISIYFQFIIIGKIENIDTISASAITPFFKYYYILLINSCIIFIFSAVYSKIIISHSITRLLDLREEIKNKKEQKAILFNTIAKTEFDHDFKNENLKEESTIDNNFSKIEMLKTDGKEKIADTETEKKHKEIEQFLEGKETDEEKQTIEEKPTESDEFVSLPKEKSKDVDKQKEIKEIKLDKESPVFTPEKNKLKQKDTYEPTVSESFEKALSSAIEKKHTKKDKIDTSKENTEEKKEEAQIKKTQKDNKESS